MCQLAKRLFFISSPNDADIMNKPKNIRLEIQSTDRANKTRENDVKMDTAHPFSNFTRGIFEGHSVNSVG